MKKYKIYFEYGAVMLWEDGAAVDCSEAEVDPILRIQMQTLADMVNVAMITADEKNEYPSPEQKILFRKLYDSILPPLKIELSKTGKIVSEAYPWVFDT